MTKKNSFITLARGTNVIKLFRAVIYKWAIKARRIRITTRVGSWLRIPTFD